MNTEDNDRLWMAYLDGELTASEAIQFEDKLSAEEQERLLAEHHIENTLGRCLTSQQDCPQDVWNRVQLKLQNAADSPRPARSRFAFKALLPIAAVLLLSVAGALWWGRASDDLAVLHEETYAQFQESSETAPTAEAIEALLASAGMSFDVVLPEEHETMHEVVLAGARKNAVGDATVAEVFLICCGHPTKLLVARIGTDGANRILKAAGEGRLAGTRTMDGYITGAVGDPMHASGLLDVLRTHA